jgi:hypothetical protein
LGLLKRRWAKRNSGKGYPSLPAKLSAPLELPFLELPFSVKLISNILKCKGISYSLKGSQRRGVTILEEEV